MLYGKLKQVGMGAGSNQGNKLDLFIFFVNQKPIGRNVTFSMSCIIAGKGVIPVLGRKGFSTGQYAHNFN